MDLEVRSSKPEDLAAVEALEPATWDGWHDPEAWRRWVDAGDAIVAERGGVVGCVHPHVFDSGEAWLEALRLDTGSHPDTETNPDTDVEHLEALLRAGVEAAEREGADVVRLAGVDAAAGAALKEFDARRSASLHPARGFAFPYGSQLRPAEFDATLDVLRETEAFEAAGGLYVTPEWRMRALPDTVDDLDDASLLGFEDDGEVRGALVGTGTRVNEAAPERRTELVMGMLWCDHDHASQMALDVRGEARDSNHHDALVFLTPGYLTSFDQAGYDVGEATQVHEIDV